MKFGCLFSPLGRRDELLAMRLNNPFHRFCYGQCIWARGTVTSMLNEQWPPFSLPDKKWAFEVSIDTNPNEMLSTARICKRVQLEYFNISLCSILLIFQFDCLYNLLHVYICPFHFGLIYQDDLQLANQFKLKNVYFCLTSIFLTLLLLSYKTINIYCHFPFAIRSQVFAKSCTLFMRLFTSQVFCFGEKAAINESSKKI